MLSIYLLSVLIALLVLLLFMFQQHTTTIFGVVLVCVFAAGWIDSKDLLAHATNEGLATLVLLIYISLTLEKTSILNRLTRFLFTKSERSSLIRTISFSGVASALLNNTAVVAGLIGSIQSNHTVKASRILLPMCYAATLGGTMTLIGTSTNLVINSMWVESGHSSIGFFDLTPIGVVVFVVGSVLLYCASHLLPASNVKYKTVDAYFVEAKVQSDSSLIGMTIEEAGLRHLVDLFLVQIIRNNRIIAPVSHDQIIYQGDKLLFSGDVQKIQILNQFDGLRLYAEVEGLTTQQLTEVAIRQESSLIGQTLKEAGFRAKFNAAVVAIKRENDRVVGKLGDIKLKPGDLLLLATGTDFASRGNIRKNFFVLSGVTPDNMLSGGKELLVLFGFVAMIAGSVFTNQSLFNMSFYLFSLLLFTGCISGSEIKRHFPINIWLIVVSALSLATAMQTVGLDQAIAKFAAQTLSGHAPIWTLLGVMLVTIIITELLTNNAAAALMFPIAYSLSIGMGINPYPMVLAVCFAASCAFISPFAYQTNLMIYNTGIYRFQDFAKVGVFVTLSLLAVCGMMIPIIYPF